MPNQGLKPKQAEAVAEAVSSETEVAATAADPEVVPHPTAVAKRDPGPCCGHQGSHGLSERERDQRDGPMEPAHHVERGGGLLGHDPAWQYLPAGHQRSQAPLQFGGDRTFSNRDREAVDHAREPHHHHHPRGGRGHAGLPLHRVLADSAVRRAARRSSRSPLPERFRP